MPLDWASFLADIAPKLIEKLTKSGLSKADLEKLTQTEREKLLVDLRAQQKLATPSIDIEMELVRNPNPSDLARAKPQLQIRLTNGGGEAIFSRAHFWVIFPNSSEYNDDKEVAPFKLFKEKEKPVAFEIRRPMYDKVIQGKATLEVKSDLLFTDTNDVYYPPQEYQHCWDGQQMKRKIG